MDKLFYFIGRLMLNIKVLFLLLGPLLLCFYAAMDIRYNKNYSLPNIAVIVYTLVYFQFLQMTGFQIIGEYVKKRLANPPAIKNNVLGLFLLSLLILGLGIVLAVASRYL